MDDIVKQAMAKWPNVPHCYGWLGLDARGNWRMRDEAAQQAGAPGDKLANTKLAGFINRNYGHDDKGRWYFQNGPQRVYVNLESTPFIARTDPAQGFVVQTGQAMGPLEGVFMTDAGALVLQAGDIVAQLDDRDVASVLARMEFDGHPASIEAIMAWLEDDAEELALVTDGARVVVERLAADALPRRFGYVPAPGL
ncbi:DUF2946 family protein [Massilia yuzhufengensis]|uniref:DUF2946 family protein n=1 Tax=Massilia yuzhufengensis TaxID=1164594 RepID=A0A1I1RR53_9BURK|nr:DUF2946 family protein [Massilia yuzhufengensis]SFD33030.1 Protein of unknown function [Massilia yuzhufengensis]